MPSKQDIIENIEKFEAHQLLKFINQGLITFDELVAETQGFFPANVRKELKKMLDDDGTIEPMPGVTPPPIPGGYDPIPHPAPAPPAPDKSEWENACRINTIEAYYDFLRNFPESEFADKARNAIIALENDWNAIDKSSIPALQRFINLNPDSPHILEARRIINSLEEEEFLGFDVDALLVRINSIQTDKSINDPDAEITEVISSNIEKNRIKQTDVLELISRDHNLLRASVIKDLINKGHLQYSDLRQIGIDERFIRALAKGEDRQRFSRPRPINKINKVSTEIYFWGIPSSGKTCALGAILSVANNGNAAKSMSMDNDCQGYGYMTRLSELFSSDGKVGSLPEGTDIYSTYEMGFDLYDNNGKVHPITCIDLAGELVRCMYKSDANDPMSNDEIEALDTLTNILVDNRTTNRKMHFFVLEYGGENRKYDGMNQAQYLRSALRYIERTQIFKKETDAIYLMITKADKTGLRGDALVEKLTQYIEDNYRGFFQGLQQICEDCGINGGKVKRIPFSLGEVCFQDYCLFSDGAASRVVEEIITRSKGFKTSKFHKGLNIFKN